MRDQLLATIAELRRQVPVAAPERRAVLVRVISVLEEAFERDRPRIHRLVGAKGTDLTAPGRAAGTEPAKMR